MHAVFRERARARTLSAENDVAIGIDSDGKGGQRVCEPRRGKGWTDDWKMLPRKKKENEI